MQADAVERLKKVLALERQRRFADAAVVGGLDRFLLNIAAEAAFPKSHRFHRVVQSLPFGGYRALHPVQRKTVVEELEKAIAGANGKWEGVTAPGRVDPMAAVPGLKKASEVKGPATATLDSPVTALKGVSRTTAGHLSRLRPPVLTVRDLLLLKPNRWEERRGLTPIAEVEPDGIYTISGTVFSVGRKGFGRGRAKQGTEARIQDETGMITVVWWGAPWMMKKVVPGARVTLTGRVGHYRGQLQMSSPEFADPDDPDLQKAMVVPVYPLTGDLKQGQVRAAVRLAVEGYADRLEDHLPEAFGLPPISEAVRMLHMPRTLEETELGLRRLAFEELMYIELGVVKRRAEWQAQGGAPVLSLPRDALAGFAESLPYRMTGDQERAVRVILEDIGKSVPMNRLLEGDVGTGKSLVAAISLLAAVTSGYQGAIMAPTEILAEQLYQAFSRMLDPRYRKPEDNELQLEEAGRGFRVLRPAGLGREVRMALLRGSLRASEKNAVAEAISRGEVDIAVGTHALIQGGVEFARLGLVVVDEQHRFGVEQRQTLREKGATPHVLVMTATPIPRTMMLTVYGDLDVTVMKEMPDDRPPVKTIRVTDRQRESAYRFVRKKIEEGRQAYIICPLVEESEAIAAKSAVAEYERLQRDVFPDLRLGLLHGRMSGLEKDAVMRRFRDGELDILVSTAVVEVGVDVPNATVIMIEGAERFGLAQLHQFRGRVRRSSMQAYCLLLSDNPSEESAERLLIMETVDDGFQLAEEDLRLRGPGEYFGTRQSGMPDLRFARLTDVELIEQTRVEATAILRADPDLARPEHAGLKAGMERFWSRVTAEAS